MPTDTIKVIAESSSTRTEWALVQGDKIIEHAYTEGLNPFFQTRREISHIIRLGLPPEFFKRRWSHVYYYGAGCSNPEKNKIVESSLVAQFKTPVTVDSDLVGATRGLLVHEPGLACILGTGSNSCLYDGNQIIKHVRSGGYILGDEGSGAAMGRLFIGDLLKGFVPSDIRDSFVEKFNLNVDLLMDEVYNNPHANRNLRNYGVFLSEHLQNEYVYRLVFNEISRFFERTILQYDYQSYAINFVGSVACQFSEVLLSVASKYGANIKKIVRASMPGLVIYHTCD
ncbi:MAG: hypothetical protein PUE25_04200 [bacterium]|nr:hypothetical protein [bacterium]